MKVITRTFGGKPLVILTGHEDFDLVFIVNQVAEVCHIDSPMAAIALTTEATGGFGFFQLREVLHAVENPERLGSWGVEHIAGDTWLASTGAAYRMLLRYDSPLEDFFKRWLIDDVLQEIQETPEALEPIDTYPDELTQLRATVRSLERRLTASLTRERRLQHGVEMLDRKLTSTTGELLALRKGFPIIATPESSSPSLLDRAQSEFDDLSYAWRRSLRGDVSALVGAQLDERLYRLRLAHDEKRRS
ncbi:MAG: hypothetical protein CVV09_19705 [Gammaproteobacteria bacterium HGW-Gammaproteobacteria-13]|nr:MAG: hypothetical protein CVV09_19705 [Gammaproteobacteria bacterium HGW-Gammaproteobacteria-13]